MRKHHSAAQARARAARACLEIITGSLMIIGLTACGGGGGDASPTNETAQPKSLADGPVRAQSITTPVLGAYIKSAGWSTALPELPTRVFEKPTSITGTTYYIDSIRSYNSQQAPLAGEDGLTPATAFTNIGQFKAQVVNATDTTKRLKAGDAILLKCGAIFRAETLSLNGISNVYIGPYQAGQVGPKDCADDKLPTLRQAKWGGGLGWTATDASNTVYSGTVNTSIARLFRYTVPAVKARYPNADSTVKYLLAKPVTTGTSSHTEFKVKDADKQYFNTSTVGNDLAGADILVRTIGWLLERRRIDKYDATTGVITLNRATSFPIQDGAGYYLAGKSWMFDQPGEWYQNGNTVYYRHQASVGNEAGELAGLEYTDSDTENSFNVGLLIRDGNNVTISRIAFEHQEFGGIGIESTDNLKIHGAEVRFASEIGIGVGRNGSGTKRTPSTNVTIEFCKIRGSRGFGIKAGSFEGNPRRSHTKNVTLRNNLVTETGMHDAAYKHTFEIKDMTAIRLGSPEALPTESPQPSLGVLDAQALGNIVINSAGPGIVLDNGRHGAVIDSNTVINACLRTSDCGAIYTNNRDESRSLPAAEGTTSATISNNIITGVKGDIEGIATSALSIRTAREQTFGIYLDDLSANIEVTNNQVTHAAGGIYLHNASWNTVHHNTIKAVTLASIEVSSDWVYPNNTFTETVRGNVIRDNVLFSHRTVDVNRFSASYLQDGIQGDAPQVYAQFWLHKNNPSTFFTGDRRNESKNNVTVTPSQVTPVTTWRMGKTFQAVQASGGVWALLQTGQSYQEMPLSNWLTRVQADSPNADTETNSPVSYRPYVLTLGNNGVSLVEQLARNSQWVWNAGSQIPYVDGMAACGGTSVCAEVTASAAWHSLVSPVFTVTPGNLYFAQYTLKQGPVRGEHNASVRRSTDYLQVGEYMQSVYTEANEVRRFEHFFRATNNGGASTVLALKPSDGVTNSPKPYTTQYFSDVSVHPVTGWSVLPPLDQLVATAANASGTPRTFRCVEDLGFAQTSCNSVRDENNQTVTFPVSVPARTMKRFYINSSTWSY